MDRLKIIFIFLIASLGLFARGNGNDINNASPAVRNALKYSCDQICTNKIVEEINLSDDFNLPKLRSFWATNTGNINFTLSERPGYLRLKSTKSKYLSSLNVNNTLSQKIQNNAFGEVVSYIELANLIEGSFTGLYIRSEKNNFIGIKIVGDKKYIVSDVDGKESKKFEIKENAIMLRLKIDRMSCWFEYSINGLDFNKLGSDFQLESKVGDENYIGLFNINNQKEGGSVDVDWFHFIPSSDIIIQYAETGEKIIAPTL